MEIRSFDWFDLRFVFDVIEANCVKRGSNHHRARRFFLSPANSWLGLDFFPSKGGKCMGFYSFDLRSFLSPRTSIGFHKRLKITRGRNKNRNQRLRLGTKFRGQSLQASKWYLKCKCRPKNWITCSLLSLLKMLIKILFDF